MKRADLRRHRRRGILDRIVQEILGAHADEHGTLTPGILQSIPTVAFANPSGNVAGNLGDVVLSNTVPAYAWYCYSGGYASGTGAAKWLVLGTLPPAAALSAITVGSSPFTYTNNDGFPENISIYGGTLTTPFIQFARGGVNTQISGATHDYTVYLDPGDGVIVTYSVAPTMVKIPAAL